ncbi:MAG: hypothetical protein JWM58_2405 [Rhizobium sp.]|nr:hypothetical protein [Rhizobium sp.]
MIFVTSLVTGLFAAMLRSLFATIAVSFLICIVFAVAFALNGASVSALLISIAGFNGGLILFAAAHIFGSGARSPE